MDEVNYGELNNIAKFIGEGNAENGWHTYYCALVDGLIDVSWADWTTDPSGHAYYESWEGEPPPKTYTGITPKPDGLPSELADVIIRALDLAYMLGIDIADAVQEKIEYNETRGEKHGGKAF